MATILYKDGITIQVEANQVQKKLADGYGVTMAKSEPKGQTQKENTEKTQKEVEDELEANRKAAEKAELDRIAAEEKAKKVEIRQAAKSAGIKGWKNAPIATLKEVLNHA